ncbi:MAG: hypothetical protein DRI73_11540 [Bacteroidetes bacterium]|nr:MAG: hypothetical protein DRI73_11540 [Bacteroidota bacterium]
MYLINIIKVIIFLSLLFLNSCSGAAPEIGQIVWQINFLKSPEKTEILPTLSLFILVEDEDGITDIESLYIIHDESELFWKLNSETWITKVISGKNWVGSNKISMNDHSSLPSGKYRIMVIDKAGDRDSLTINIASGMLELPDVYSFPELIIGSDIIIDSGFSDNTLRVYDEPMELLKNLKIESGTINRSIIMKDTNNKAHWISIYSYNPDEGTGFVCGPYLINN